MFGAIATPNGDPFGMTIVALPMIALACAAMGVALLNDKRRARRAAATGTDGLPAVAVPLQQPQEITEIELQRAGFGVL